MLKRGPGGFVSAAWVVLPCLLACEALAHEQTPVAPKMTPTIALSSVVPDGASGNTRVRVLAGEVAPKSGPILRSREFYIVDKEFPEATDYVFPDGTGIVIGEGGVTLKGQPYPAGSYLVITPKRTIEAQQNAIALSSNVPLGAKAGNTSVEVLSGIVLHKWDAVLTAGSSFYIWDREFPESTGFTFPEGTAIKVGEGGVTLKGQHYAEGTHLVITPKGTLKVVTKK